MTFMKAHDWRWWPAIFRSEDHRAPYAAIIHVGPVLIFLGRRK